MLYSFSRLFSPARPRPLCTAAARKKKGFNLIEAAIVLGVVGLVIGGIWVAASVVNENLKINKTVEGIVLGSQNALNLIVPSLGVPDTTAWTTLDDICIKTNMFSTFPLINGQIQTPFYTRIGSTYSSYADAGVRCAIHTNAIVIYFVVPTGRLCQRIAAAITARFKDYSDLRQIRLYGSDNAGKTISSFPMSPFGTDCLDRVEPPQIRLYFNFRLIN